MTRSLYNITVIGQSLKKKQKKIRRSSRLQVDDNTVWGSRIRPQICFYMNRIKSYDRECTKKTKKKPPLPAAKTKLLHTTPPSPVTAQQHRRPRAPTDQPPPWPRPQPAPPLPPRRPRRGPRLGSWRACSTRGRPGSRSTQCGRGPCRRKPSAGWRTRSCRLRRACWVDPSSSKSSSVLTCSSASIHFCALMPTA